MDSKSSFVCKHLLLIDEEHNEEVEQRTKLRDQCSTVELLRKGICLNKLRILNLKTGLYGRFIVTFSNSSKESSLISHSFTVGDILGIYQSKDRQFVVSGVVTSVNESSISIAIDDSNDDLNDNETNFCLIKLSNNVTHRRLKNALNSLNNYPTNARASNLVDVLFGKEISEPLLGPTSSDITFVNKNLNESQRDAVSFALRQKEIAIIHGPPGTGKTTTLVEYIVQLVLQNQKVLVCAPSNVAVDNLVEKIIASNVKAVLRLGHPARALPSSQKVTLDAVLAASDDYRLIDDIRKEIDSIRKKRGSVATRGEIRQLIKDLKRREKKALSEFLFNSKVIVSTLTTAANDGVLKNLFKSECPENQFDVVVIDECSQAIEASCWIVLTNAPKCVIAGDHKQLPPTIISEKAAKGGLEITLMERLLKLHPQEKIMKMLTVQYRMNEKIMKWSSRNFYDDKLVAHKSNSGHTLLDIVKSVDINPILLIDTTGCSMNELDVEDEQSKGNEGEANIVALYVQSLVKMGVNPSEIGVITPYNLQVEMIRTRLSEKYPTLEIKSVDGFQGREKEVIVLSLVRSNDEREVGFLSEFRRINVAVTRAKRHVAVICDSDTVCNDPNLDSLVDYIMTNGEVKSAHEFESELKQFESIARPEHLKFKAVKTITKNKTKKISKSTVTSNDGFPRKELTAEEEMKRRENITFKYTKIITQFVNSDNTNYVFSKRLSSFERMIIHEISERLNLCHRSKGENKERIVEIWKPQQQDSSDFVKEETQLLFENEPSNQFSDEDIDDNEVDDNKTFNEVIETQRSTKKRKPKKKSKTIENKDLAKPDNETVKCEKKSTSPAKVKNINEQLENADEDNLDDLLAAIKKIDSVCAFVNCKSKVSVLGQNCQFCSRRFCMSHSLPEIHGCGDAVRSFARSTVRKDGKLYPGLGIPSKKCDSVKHGQLQRLLTKKVTEMSDKRKTKRK